MSIITPKQKVIALIVLSCIYGFVFNPWSSFPFTFIIIIISILIYTYIEDKSLKQIGLNPNTSILNTLKTVIVYTIITIISVDFIIQPGINKLVNKPVDYSSFEVLKNNYSLYIKYVIYVIISAAIGEEILFRGFVFRQLNIVLNKVKFKTEIITIISALLFSLPHFYQGFTGLIITFIFGILFAIIYVKSNYNLWTSIITHGIIDVIFLTLAYYDKLDYYTFINDKLIGY